MGKTIPKAVTDAFKKRLGNSEYTINILGKYKDDSVYTASYDYHEIGGLPDVFLYNNGQCKFAGIEGPSILRYFASTKL